MYSKMRKHTGPFLAVILGTALCSIAGQAQQPGPAKDPVPFARPQPLTGIKSGNPRQTLADLAEIVKNNGFEVSDLNLDRGELQAIRKDSGNKGNTDRILLWLERDFSDPTSKVTVYFSYARFELFFGTTEAVRIKADRQFEQDHAGAVKDAVLRYALVKG